jgi:uncharacterized membrane protein YfcA
LALVARTAVTDVGALAWLALAFAALLVGFAKTAIGGAASISVAVFATVTQARASTGALLALLLVGDVVAVLSYRGHAQWGMLLRLLPAVVVGVVAGAIFVERVDDTVMKRTIGVILLFLVAVGIWQRGRVRDGPTLASHQATGGYGVLAGFTTMVANAGGPVMAMYLLAARLEVLRFLGTTAWFFFLVNLIKLPFSIRLGLVTRSSLLLDITLVPLVLVGTVVGRFVIRSIDQGRFETLVLVFTVVSTVPLLV